MYRSYRWNLVKNSPDNEDSRKDLSDSCGHRGSHESDRRMNNFQNSSGLEDGQFESDIVVEFFIRFVLCDSIEGLDQNDPPSKITIFNIF